MLLNIVTNFQENSNYPRSQGDLKLLTSQHSRFLVSSEVKYKSRRKSPNDLLRGSFERNSPPVSAFRKALRLCQIIEIVTLRDLAASRFQQRNRSLLARVTSLEIHINLRNRTASTENDVKSQPVASLVRIAPYMVKILGLLEHRNDFLYFL